MVRLNIVLPSLDALRWFPSLETCQHYDIHPDCTVVWSEDVTRIMAAEGTVFGQYEGGPDLAGFGVVLQTIWRT